MITNTTGASESVTKRLQAINSRPAILTKPYEKVGVNLEPHGPFTQNLELMVKLLKEFDSPWLGVNFDTGNTFIAGHDPLTYLKAIRPWLRHVHCKDVHHWTPPNPMKT